MCVDRHNTPINITYIYGSSTRALQVLKGLSVTFSKKLRGEEPIKMVGNLKRSVDGFFSLVNPEEVKGDGVKTGYGVGGGGGESRIKKGELKLFKSARLDNYDVANTIN